MSRALLRYGEAAEGEGGGGEGRVVVVGAVLRLVVLVLVERAAGTMVAEEDMMMIGAGISRKQAEDRPGSNSSSRGGTSCGVCVWRRW